MANDWLELRQHAETGIETIKAHFEGHAFDPHWHDSYLVGITLSGTQQFHCRRERHRSQPGDAFLLEPGEIHDGDAPVEGGFTYLTFIWMNTGSPVRFKGCMTLLPGVTPSTLPKR